MTEPEPFTVGDPVVLRSRDGHSHLLRLTPGTQSIPSLGVLDLTALVGRSPGSPVEWAGSTYRALRPSLADLLGQLHRKAQIIHPKDALQMLFLAGLRPGGRAVEAGAGSGALTLVLAHFVGPSGHVITFDRRQDFLDVARTNVLAGGFADRVEFRQRDVAAEGFDASGVDSVFLDLPEPWSVARAARDALAVGGGVAAFTPTYNQLERTVREFRSVGFQDVRSLELLERSLHVGEGGTRPEFDMLAHTGFLTGARRVE